MRRWIAVPLAVALLAGCGKEPPVDASPPRVASAPEPPAPAKSPSPPRAEGTSTTAPQPARVEPGSPSGSGGNSGGTVVAEPTGAVAMPNVGEMVVAPVTVMIEQKRKIALMEAKDILRTYEAMNGEWPKSLEEAAKALRLKCPLPADGWRWKYDPQTGEIDMVKD